MVAKSKSENLDVRGKSCPWPVLLTREHLGRMNSGDILEVAVDYRPAKENVERFAKSNGHKVLKVVDMNRQFKIIIEKK